MFLARLSLKISTSSTIARPWDLDYSDRDSFSSFCVAIATFDILYLLFLLLGFLTGLVVAGLVCCWMKWKVVASNCVFAVWLNEREPD